MNKTPEEKTKSEDKAVVKEESNENTLNEKETKEKDLEDIETYLKEHPEMVVTAKDSIKHMRCGSVDVHKKILVAAICITDPTTLAACYIVQRFSTKNANIETMAEWFQKYEVKDVIMESTGKYWIPVYNILEGKGLSPILTHPKYVKQVRGKKTDIRDAIHMANLLRMGHYVASFIPPSDIRDVRELCRYRLKLTYVRTGEKNRYQNCMTVSQVRLDTVLKDPFGKTAQAIMKYLLSVDPDKASDEEIAKLINPRVKATTEEILDSIHGYCFPQVQRDKLQVISDHLNWLDKEIGILDTSLQEKGKSYAKQIRHLKSHPGIDDKSAIFIIGEIGVDMSVWSDVNALCSWAGVTPANNESANKKKSTRISDGGHYLKPLLVQCALAAIKNDYFRAKYENIRRRRGHKKAIIAIAHKMLIDIYHMLKNDEDYKPKDLETVTKKIDSQRNTTESQLTAALEILKQQGISSELLNSINNQLRQKGSK